VDVSVAPELADVTLDPMRFKQVVYNLLSNALKFTDNRGRVEIRCAGNGLDDFTLSVQDTGIGIKPENLGRLFKRFEQIDQGSGRRYQGTGLGLALTRKIVEMQGGRISVASEFGKGTTFTVVLPRAFEGAPGMSQARILIVDDNPVNVKLTANVLERDGYEILQAADALQALAIIGQTPPDLILIDISLPGMDGLTLTRRLKADPATRHIIMVALTAFAMKGDDQKAWDAGCDGYITKPIDTRKLPLRIAEILRRSRETSQGHK